MPDYSIAMQGQPVNIKSPAQAVQEAAQAKNAMLRNRAIGQEMQDREALNQAYRDAGGNINAMVDDPRLGFDASMQIKGMQAEQTRAQAQADVDQQIKMLEYGSQILSGASDQASWDSARQQFASIFGDQAANNLPAQYDKKMQQDMVMRGVSMRDKIAMQRDEAKYQQQEMLQNMRHQQTLAAISARGGDGGGQREPKEARRVLYDREGNAHIVDINAVPTGKLFSGDAAIGKPAASTTATEDERKAAGWFSQARLASQQMAEALAEDPSAAKKPFSESLAARVPFVTEEDISAQMSPARQRFTAAAASFSEAALRAATGAGINESETRQKIAELTPRYGESEQTIKDKLERQEMYLQSLELRAGRALPKNTQQTTAPDKPPFWDRMTPEDQAAWMEDH